MRYGRYVTGVCGYQLRMWMSAHMVAGQADAWAGARVWGARCGSRGVVRCSRARVCVRSIEWVKGRKRPQSERATAPSNPTVVYCMQGNSQPVLSSSSTLVPYRTHGQQQPVQPAGKIGTTRS